ncbi:MAG: hypothetical protein PHO56_02165 [Patescibacteria group bacterium]|nr:hypothetical protein [Patescibacteria group bacterium]
MAKRHAQERGEERQRGFKYECVDCGEKITSTLDIDEVKCPNNENHTMVQK